MEAHLADKQDDLKSSKGGLKTMPFIIANETFANLAGFGLSPNMIIYLTREYHMSVATGNFILFMWGAASNFLTILGAFISDSYLGRFSAISLGSVASFIGVTLMWLTAMIPGARPPPCNPSHHSCESPTSSQLALLAMSFLMMSLGNAGVRPCSMAFGADQLIKRDEPNKGSAIQSYFNWYYVSVGVAVMVSMTLTVYIQVNKGWKIGFAIPAILMFLSTILFFLGSPLYIKMESNKNLFIGLTQVMVAAFRNRDLDFPPENDFVMYHKSKGSKLLAPTGKLRCLNKACIIRDREKDLTLDGLPSKPWNLCVVDRVEDLKSLVKLIPIWSTSIIVSLILSQGFITLEAETMDRHLGLNFKFPSASLGVFGVIIFTIWIPIYEKIIIPLVGKISYKQRMGTGLIMSCASIAWTAMIEHFRRKSAIQEGRIDDSGAMVNMSAFWFVPTSVLLGLVEFFSCIGQLEFYYNELPQSMSSIGMSLASLAGGFASLIGALILTVVKNITSKGGKQSWLATNINKGHLDYYYWFLLALACINVPYFLLCSWGYGPCNGESKDREKGLEEKEEEDAAMSKVTHP